MSVPIPHIAPGGAPDTREVLSRERFLLRTQSKDMSGHHNGSALVAVDIDAPDGLLALRALVALSDLDQRIGDLQLREIGLVQRLEKLRRTAQDAYDDLREREIHIFFLECSGRYSSAPGLDRARAWLTEARSHCQGLASAFDEQAVEAQMAFEKIQQSMHELVRARDQIIGGLSAKALAGYRQALAAGLKPALAALVGSRCEVCGGDVGKLVADVHSGALRPCPHCARVLHCRRLLW